jgi:hypothetical protein
VPLPEAKVAGALGAYDMIGEVLKVCSNDALACSRNFLEFRMTEAKVSLESQKGHLLDSLDARNAIVGGLRCYYVILQSAVLLCLTLSLAYLTW